MKRRALAAAAAALAVGATAAPAHAVVGAYAPSFYDGSVSQFGIGAGGLLAPLTPATVAAGTDPRMAAISRDGRSLYVPDGSGSPGTILQYTINPDATLTPKSPASVTTPGGGTDALAVSPDGMSLYGADATSGDVAQFDVAPDGRLSPETPASVPTGSGSVPRRVVVSPDGASAYVSDCSGGRVLEYDVGAGGRLAPKPTPSIATGGCPYEEGLTPDGRSLYVGDQSSPWGVFQFDVGPGGALAAKTPARVPDDDSSGELAVSPDGRSVYVSNTAAPGSIAQFTVGAGGALVPKSPATVTTPNDPFGLTVTSDGRSLYVAAAAESMIAQFDVAADGTLGQKSPFEVPARSGVLDVVVPPDQAPTAAFAVTPAAPGKPTAFDGTASSDADGTVTRWDWDFGDGTSAANAGPHVAHVYASPGRYTARLTVSDEIGCSTATVFTGRTASCAGDARAASTTTVAVSPARPRLRARRMTPATFAAASRGASISVRRRRHVGTRIVYRDSAAAMSTLTFASVRAGTRRGRRCVAPSRGRHGHPRRCTRFVRVGSVRHADRAGMSTLRFSGRLRGRRLRPGRYRLTVVARNAGGASRPVRARFRVIR